MARKKIQHTELKKQVAALETDGSRDQNLFKSTYTISSEDMEKLKRIDEIEKEKSALITEKEQLTELITSYVEEIDSLKETLEEARRSNSTSIKSSKKTELLEKNVKSLQDTNDEYLMKINSLAVENQMLKNQILDLQKTVMHAQKTNPERLWQSSQLNNGYGSWN